MGSSIEAVRAELSAAMTGASPGLAAANELCSACVDLFGVDGAAVSVMQDNESRGTFGSSNAASRQLDEYQFTFGEGPCLDAALTRETVQAPDLDAPQEQRWPVFAGAVLADGIRGVFALPILVTSGCVGALDLFRAAPGPMQAAQLGGARVAAELASTPLLTLISDSAELGEDDDPASAAESRVGLDRIEVYQATGILIAHLDVDAGEALVRLRAHAIATGQTASQVAWAIVEQGLVLERDDAGDLGGRHR